MRILLVDDDRELIDLLAFALKRAGLEPIAAHDASGALRQYEEREPDLVVLDINLGNSNGLDVLKELRRRGQLPVIMLTALDSEEDKVRGLELGADDYLTKPFSHRELIARIRAQLRRSGQDGSQPGASPRRGCKWVRIMLDLAEHSVTKAGQPVSLTVTEFRLLHCLMSHAGSGRADGNAAEASLGLSRPRRLGRGAGHRASPASEARRGPRTRRACCTRSRASACC